MTAPLIDAAVAGATRSRMPRRKALSLWKARPSRVSVKLVPVAVLVMPAACRRAGRACRSPPCSGSRAGRPRPPISTFEPTMFAPPARSMQMNGILPAPCTAMPQLAFSASRSGDRAAIAARGLANRLNTVGAAMRGEPRAEALREEVAARDRALVRGLVPDRLVGAQRARWWSCGSACVRPRFRRGVQCSSVAALPSSAAQLALTTVSVRSAAQAPPQLDRRVISASRSPRTPAASGSVATFVRSMRPTSASSTMARPAGAKADGRRRVEVEARGSTRRAPSGSPPARCSTGSTAAPRPPGVPRRTCRPSRPSAATA